MNILSGITARNALREKLVRTIKGLKLAPTLVIIQVGSRADSTTYIEQKKKFAATIGVPVIHEHMPATASEKRVISCIQKYNQDKNIAGIIVQIPIPKHLHKERILNTIKPEKDVDGLTEENTKRLFDGRKGIIPATARGIISLLDFYNIKIEGRHVVVVGRSTLVGKPTALAFLNRNATVTIAHKHTKNLEKITKSADILVIAIGDPEFISKKHVSKNQVVIDVGINLKNKKLVGDTDFEHVSRVVKALSPVPGGVGPMTVVSLFQNLVDGALTKR